MTFGPATRLVTKRQQTLGYREYLRKGRVRKEQRRKFPSQRRLDELAACFDTSRCNPSHLSEFANLPRTRKTSVDVDQTFRDVSLRPYIQKLLKKIGSFLGCLFSAIRKFPRLFPDPPDSPARRLKWLFRGIIACRNGVFEPVGTFVLFGKSHADSA